MDIDVKVNLLSRPISFAEVTEINELKFHCNLKKSKIFDRAWYVYTVIAKEFKVKIPSYQEYSTDRLEYVDGYLEDDYSETFSEYYLNPLRGAGRCIAVIKGKEYDLAGGFPTRWLFSEFEKELADGVKEYEKVLFNKKNQDKIKKKISYRKSKIIEKLKKSMTPEEIEIVFGKPKAA
jgi:hypothetical protein